MKTAVSFWLGALLCAAISVIASSLFLPKQSLWIDESMQLAGDRLGPGHVIPFLTGRERPADISPDRTPPVGYWVQQAWGRVFGLEERSLRWLGVCCVALATVFVFAAAAHAFGLAAGWIGGLLFALSPNVIYLAVDIRAYPLFVLFSAATAWAFVRFSFGASEAAQAEGGSRRRRPGSVDKWLWISLALGLVTCYVHFFGVVLVVALLIATLITRRVKSQPMTPVSVAVAIFLIVASDLYPFVTASIGVSHQITPDGEATSPVREIVRLVYRLVAHPAMAVSRVFIVAALLGSAVALFIALLVARKSALFLALIFGLLAVCIAAFVVKSFHPAAPHYNDWALPLLFILLPAGLAAKQPLRIVCGVGLALLLIAEIYSTTQLARRGQFFAHGPYARIAADVATLDRRVAVIIDDPNPATAGGTYYPLRDLLGRGVEQYVSVPSAGDSRVRAYGSSSVPISVDDLKDRTLVVIRTRNVPSSELAARLRTDSPEGATLVPGGAIGEHLKNRLIQTRLYLSFVAARVDFFDAAH
jgi:hypothetical protein